MTIKMQKQNVKHWQYSKTDRMKQHRASTVPGVPRRQPTAVQA